MREIKFRAQAGPKGEWEYFTLPQDAGYIAGRDKQKRLKHLTEFTGLKDKNGKEIYEGDIVQTFFDEKPFSRGKVNFNETRLQFCIGFAPLMNVKVEVIGNIHENPELLELKK